MLMQEIFMVCQLSPLLPVPAYFGLLQEEINEHFHFNFNSALVRKLQFSYQMLQNIVDLDNWELIFNCILMDFMTVLGKLFDYYFDFICGSIIIIIC